MTEHEGGDQQAAGIPEGTRDDLLDALLDDWPQIAATAWDGFRAHGRGTVTITPGTAPTIAYHPGPPCDCHGDAVAAYDPESQAVVAVVRDEEEVVWMETLSGWPNPPDAASSLSAAERDATLQ